jgi:lipopolysaccharide transport system ATP-binding protein
VITTYLSASREDRSEQAWDDLASAPGNDKVRLRRVAVRPQEPDHDSTLTMDTPLAVEVEYWNVDPGTPLHVVLRFMTEEHVVAFSTASHEDSPLEHNSGAAGGLYRCVCYLPGDLLNEGTYRMTLLIVRDAGKVIYRMEDALAFEIVNGGLRPGFRYNGEPGAVRPRLLWDVEHLQRA